MAEVTTNTNEYAELLKITIDHKTGEVTPLADGVFDKVLEKAGLDRDTYKKVSDLNASVAAGLGKALGDASVPAFKENKELTETSVVLKTVGHEKFKASFDRSGTSRNPKTQEVKTIYGVLNVEHSTATKGGQYGAVKALLRQQAEEAYGD